ncbi:MAG: hypothetical protein AB3N13_09145 [Arenibacterium sp.]
MAKHLGDTSLANVKLLHSVLLVSVAAPDLQRQKEKSAVRSFSGPVAALFAALRNFALIFLKLLDGSFPAFYPNVNFGQLPQLQLVCEVQPNCANAK